MFSVAFESVVTGFLRHLSIWSPSPPRPSVCVGAGFSGVWWEAASGTGTSTGSLEDQSFDLCSLGRMLIHPTEEWQAVGRPKE